MGVFRVCSNHTIIKHKGTILKNYCKGLNKDGDIFWLMMDKNSIDFDVGIGKITYRKGTGKFNKYEGVECLYAITFLANGNGTFQKAKCKFKNVN